MMKGNIKAYSKAVNAGVIEGDDGRTYLFGESHWQGPNAPRNDDTVTFKGVGTKASNVQKT